MFSLGCYDTESAEEVIDGTDRPLLSEQLDQVAKGHYLATASPFVILSTKTRHDRAKSLGCPVRSLGNSKLDQPLLQSVILQSALRGQSGAIRNPKHGYTHICIYICIEREQARETIFDLKQYIHIICNPIIRNP